MSKYSFILLTLLLVSSVLFTTEPSASVDAQDDGATLCAATHYPDFGDCEAAPDNEVEVSYAVFNNRENDPIAVDSATVAEVSKLLSAEAGASFVFLNDWANVSADSNSIQIINNIPINGAVYTVILPIGWTPDGSYPVILSGNGAGTSNNQRLYEGQEFMMPRLVAQSTLDGRSGAIAVMSNTGGTESQGVDEPTYESVGSFFAWVEAEAGGNPEQFITAGGSRGGGSALMWAANPLGLDYNVRAVFADIPPVRYGTLTQRSAMTYPSLAGINMLVLGNPFAFVYGDDDGPGQPYARSMEYIIGTGDPVEADALSPIAYVDNLAGKDILIGHGTHDSFFQLALFLEFDRALDAAGIEHGTYITLGQGHAINIGLWEQTFSYVMALIDGSEYSLPTGRQIWIDTTPSGGSAADVLLNDHLESTGQDTLPEGELPFTVEFPYLSAVDLPMDVSACGAVGADFEVSWQAPDTDEATVLLSGTFDETECMSLAMTTPETLGEYVWTATYRGEPVNNLNTPIRGEDGCATVLAVTTIADRQPFLAANFAFDGSLAWGIDQFSAQPDTCPMN